MRSAFALNGLHAGDDVASVFTVAYANLAFSSGMFPFTECSLYGKERSCSSLNFPGEDFSLSDKGVHL